MADAFRIEISVGLPAIDGTYELDLEFTNAELHTIKRVSGLRPREFEDALDAADMDLVVALAIVALQRAGKYDPHGREVEEALWGAKAGKIRLVGPEADAVPPPSATDELPSPSGTSSSDASATPEANLSASGDLTSVVGAA